jgi:hypothetical protein
MKDEDYNFSLIEYYHEHNAQNNAFQIVNEQFVKDIDFRKLFVFLDRTRSKIGQQFLYNKLLTIDKTLDFGEQENLIAELNGNAQKMQLIEKLLPKLAKRETYYIPNLIFDGYVPKPRWFLPVKLLAFASLATLIFLIIYGAVFIWIMLFIYLINLALHLWNKRNIMVYMDSIPQLPAICSIAKTLSESSK